MKTVNEQKAYFLSRAEWFIEDLKSTTNPFDVEAKIYALMHLATRSHQEIHKMNSEEKFEVIRS